MTINLSPEVIEHIKKAILNPLENELADKRSITDCFEKSEEVTAKHILAKEFIDNEYPCLPKLVLYIIMDQVFGLCNGKDEKGDLGYYLKYRVLINPS